MRCSILLISVLLRKVIFFAFRYQVICRAYFSETYILRKIYDITFLTARMNNYIFNTTGSKVTTNFNGGVTCGIPRAIKALAALSAKLVIRKSARIRHCKYATTRKGQHPITSHIKALEDL